MIYGSCFSGIEAASVVFEPLGWTPAFFAEVEKFPCAVLAHHWPGVPNLGDVTTVDWSGWRANRRVLYTTSADMLAQLTKVASQSAFLWLRAALAALLARTSRSLRL